jgi:hypothetical protein
MLFTRSFIIDKDPSWVLGGVSIFGIDCLGLNRFGFGAPGEIYLFGGFIISIRGFLVVIKTSTIIILILKDCASSIYLFLFLFFLYLGGGGLKKVPQCIQIERN